MRIDHNGKRWSDIITIITSVIAGVKNVLAVAGSVSQADSPLIGPADVVAGSIIVGAVVKGAIKAEKIIKDKNRREIEEQLPEIAKKHKTFECKESANAMLQLIQKKKQNGSIIEIRYDGIGLHNAIWSESRSMVISEDGYHCGIMYNGRVYCNVHPEGLPYDIWCSDFVGFGEKHIYDYPF